MSYQIKSTPFFRRIVSTSKKNGELQKLKEEYDRIKDFNEEHIEMKMRQVRLRRLFREIEEIKESNTAQARRRRAGQDGMKTMDEIRLETFVKAKELGKEYSKLNALMVERTCSRVDQAEAVAAASRQEKDKRVLSAKRISYGNEMSRHNMEKAQFTPRPAPARGFIRCSQVVDKKLEQLKNRISYGNSQSSINMIKVPKRPPKVKNASTLVVVDEEPTEPTKPELTEEKTLTPEPMPREQKKYKTFEQLQNSKVHIMKFPQTFPERNNRQHAKQLWNKLRLLVLYRFDTVSRRTQLPLNQTEEYEEYKLCNTHHTLLPHQLQMERVDVESCSDTSSMLDEGAETYDDANQETNDKEVIASENLVKQLAMKFERGNQPEEETKTVDDALKLQGVFNHISNTQ